MSHDRAETWLNLLHTAALDCRTKQKAYFKSRETAALHAAKQSERKLDTVLDNFAKDTDQRKEAADLFSQQ